ncbi:HPr kinase/phosphorylase [Brevundimonas sp.]
MIQPLHAGCVALFGRSGWVGVLIRGASGSGKSDLALRLMDAGARLVADDATIVRPDGGVLHATCPPTIQGRMEIRGLGVVEAPARPSARLGLVVRCLAEAPERLPEPRTWTHAGIALPLLEIDARAPSAALVVRHAVQRL